MNPAFEGSSLELDTIAGKIPAVEVVGQGPVVDDDDHRDKWTNPIEFLLSCISVSVGLGNIWRFPYVAFKNGGGAFLIPYIIVLIVIGRPMYFLEMILGQFSSSGSVKVWNVVPFAKGESKIKIKNEEKLNVFLFLPVPGLGYTQGIASWLVITYYVVLMALSFFYLFCSFSNPLPWSWCNPEWANMDTCYSSSDNISLLNLTSTLSSSSEQFFKYIKPLAFLAVSIPLQFWSTPVRTS